MGLGPSVLNYDKIKKIPAKKIASFKKKYARLERHSDASCMYRELNITRYIEFTVHVLTWALIWPPNFISWLMNWLNHVKTVKTT